MTTAMQTEVLAFVRGILSPYDLFTDAEELIARYEAEARALLAKLDKGDA